MAMKKDTPSSETGKGDAAAGIAYRPLTVEKLSTRPYIRFGLAAMALWLILAWLLSAQITGLRTREALAEAQKATGDSIGAMRLGLQRNLEVFHGIPAVIGRDAAVHQALARLAAQPRRPAALSPEERSRQWQADGGLAALNRSLAGSVRDIGAFSVIWVMDPAGFCIAASNFDKEDSFIGTTYADRSYFRQALAKRFGHQFAIGRVSHIPGLFFSAPVMEEDQVVGVVAAKLDQPVLSSWVSETNAFITDGAGVIIAAHHRKWEMRALPEAAALRMETAERISRYNRENLPPLSVAPWGDPPVPLLHRLDGETVPVLMTSAGLPEDELQVTVVQPVPEIAESSATRLRLFSDLAVIGAAVIGALAGTLFFIKNRDQRKRVRETSEQVEYLANHDVLTGLFSRAVSDRLIHHGIELSRRHRHKLGVLFIDLDHFKEINDTLGHDTGDRVLRHVAQVLNRSVRTADVIIRQGGDEFILLLHDLSRGEDAGLVAQKILERLKVPFPADGRSLELSASIGLAFWPDDGETPEQLLQQADIAMYRAKERGRGTYCFAARAEAG